MTISSTVDKHISSFAYFLALMNSNLFTTLMEGAAQLFETVSLADASDTSPVAQILQDVETRETAGRPENQLVEISKDKKRRRRHGRPISATVSPYFSPTAASSAVSPANVCPPTPNLGSSPSFTPSIPPSSVLPLLNVSLPTASSTDSIVSTPTHGRSPRAMPPQLHLPAQLPDTPEFTSSGIRRGLGLFAESGGLSDGLGILPRIKSIEEDESEMPSRIFLEEIYYSFSSPKSPSVVPPFPTNEPSAVGEIEDVFSNIGGLSPIAQSTPSGTGSSKGKHRIRSRLRVGSVESDMTEFMWDYVRPTIASRVMSMRAEGEDLERSAEC
ncbi:hypothetical protein EW146_g272 [Bondarzewia mesenterica]|uniref:Uncharacterized protein n=1 Tax=Bondarzewia mesenterica TaxID=1095465 RepID=A0A4S4M825_9AGAM|nr:hypothetical protein EW146_g272 [Bondarzewia mesenterica]